MYSLSFFFKLARAQRERLLGVVSTLLEYWNCWHSWKRKMVFPRPLPRPNGEQMWSYGGAFALPLNERKWKRSFRFLSPYLFFIFSLSIVRIGCTPWIFPMEHGKTVIRYWTATTFVTFLPYFFVLSLSIWPKKVLILCFQWPIFNE